MAYGHGSKRPGAGRKPGRMNATTACVREIALTHGSAAIDKAARLAGLVVDADGKPIGMATSEQAQIAALSIILDRAYGKPSQAHVLEGNEDHPIRSTIEMIIVDPKALPSDGNARRNGSAPSSDGLKRYQDQSSPGVCGTVDGPARSV